MPLAEHIAQQGALAGASARAVRAGYPYPAAGRNAFAAAATAPATPDEHALLVIAAEDPARAVAVIVAMMLTHGPIGLAGLAIAALALWSRRRWADPPAERALAAIRSAAAQHALNASRGQAIMTEAFRETIRGNWVAGASSAIEVDRARLLALCAAVKEYAGADLAGWLPVVVSDAQIAPIAPRRRRFAAGTLDGPPSPSAMGVSDSRAAAEAVARLRDGAQGRVFEWIDGAGEWAPLEALLEPIGGRAWAIGTLERPPSRVRDCGDYESPAQARTAAAAVYGPQGRAFKRADGAWIPDPDLRYEIGSLAFPPERGGVGRTDDLGAARAAAAARHAGAGIVFERAHGAWVPVASALGGES